MIEDNNQSITTGLDSIRGLYYAPVSIDGAVCRHVEIARNSLQCLCRRYGAFPRTSICNGGLLKAVDQISILLNGVLLDIRSGNGHLRGKCQLILKIAIGTCLKPWQ